MYLFVKCSIQPSADERTSKSYTNIVKYPLPTVHVVAETVTPMSESEKTDVGYRSHFRGSQILKLIQRLINRSKHI